MNKKRIVILGSTGSVGVNAVKVAKHLKDEIEVVGVAARNNVELLAQQARELQCPFVVSSDPAAKQRLESLVPESCTVMTGDNAMTDLAIMPEVKVVLCAIVGTGGLTPVLGAIKAGKTIALASKEILVMAGEIVMAETAASGSVILPVDSEHSAIFQCLEGRRHEDVSKLILTASGGPFRNSTRADIECASMDHALTHPVWDMGPKVTIDSASMMNKALEIIEAKWLFDVPPEKIDVVIHPQSLIHSMVEFVDGTLLTQMSTPDMRFPIQYALTYPRKLPGGLKPFDFNKFRQISFELPDRNIFPSLDFAYFALREGGTMPAVMNAANETAVDMFRKGKIKFHEIWNIIEQSMSKHDTVKHPSLDEIMEADRWAKDFAQNAASAIGVQVN